jgi:hypothetical protein
LKGGKQCGPHQEPKWAGGNKQQQRTQVFADRLTAVVLGVFHHIAPESVGDVYNGFKNPGMTWSREKGPVALLSLVGRRADAIIG